MAVTNFNPANRTRAQIEADLGATRDRLTAAVEALVEQVHPSAIKRRQVAGVKHLAHVELENAKSLVFNARGDLRKDRLARVGGAVGGFLAFLAVVRTVARRTRNR